MILFPAIDLKDGAAVRLLRGEMGTAKVYNPDPAAQARAFADAGFEWVHVVDLNGAFAGRSENAEAVDAILAAFPGRVQLGGGLRERASIDFWLERGVARVILGTAAVKDPALVEDAAQAYPDRILVGLDARAKGADPGDVAIAGWAEASDLAAIDLAKRFAATGIAGIVYTDIERDGALQGVNVAATLKLAEASGLAVIASGGIASLDDIAALRAAGAAAERGSIEGAIVGRAFYDGRIDPRAALALIAEDPAPRPEAGAC